MLTKSLLAAGLLLALLGVALAQQSGSEQAGSDGQSMPMQQTMMRCQQRHQQMVTSMDELSQALAKAAAAPDLATAKQAVNEAQSKLWANALR
jgi:hypothetical protein